MKTATLRTTQTQVLEDEFRRLRRTLESIRDLAAKMSESAKVPSAVLGFAHLSATAGEELERAA